MLLWAWRALALNAGAQPQRQALLLGLVPLELPRSRQMQVAVAALLQLGQEEARVLELAQVPPPIVLLLWGVRQGLRWPMYWPCSTSSPASTAST